MPYHALLEYIRTAKDYGTSDDEISRRLTRAGWYTIDVQDAIELYRRLTANTVLSSYAPQDAPPAPTMSERLLPRHYDVHAVVLFSIAVLVGAGIYLALTGAFY